MLKYETDQSIADTAALHAEASRIWLGFRAEAEGAGVQSAVLSATSPSSASSIGRSRGYNFVYIKQSDGKWYEVRPSSQGDTGATLWSRSLRLCSWAASRCPSWGSYWARCTFRTGSWV